MIPRLAPYLRPRDLLNLFSTDGTSGESIEKRFAEMANSKYALLLPYGRSAVYFLLKAYGIREKEILLPAYTCQSMIGPILETKNIPVFVDSRENSFNINEDEINSNITTATKAILAASMYGTPIRLAAYKEIKSSRPDIHLIGDYALGLFTYLTQQKKDALNVLDMVFFSFGLGKEITFLGGGMLITNSRELYEKIRTVRDEQCHRPGFIGFVKTISKFITVYLLFKPVLYTLLYYLSEKTTLLNKQKGLTIGIQSNLPDDFNVLPSKFQIDVAFQRIRHIQDFIADRKRAINAYQIELRRIIPTGPRRIILPNYCDTMSHFPIRVLSSERDALLHYFINHNIHTTVIFRKTLDAFCDDNWRASSDLTHAHAYTDELVMLPLYQGIKTGTIERVVTTLVAWQREVHDQ